MRILLLSLTLFIVGCAATHKMNKLQVGMTKQEVVQAMGEPYSTSAKDNTEYLKYALWKDFWDRYPGSYSDYFFVRIINGKVDAFGREGDFDSTKIPAQKVIIDVNTNNPSTANPPPRVSPR